MAKNTLSLVASGQAIPAGRGQVIGAIVNSHSSGVIKLIDSPNSASGRVMFGGNSGFTLPTGSSVQYFSDKGVEYYEGVNLLVVSGTVDIQLIFEPTV